MKRNNDNTKNKKDVKYILYKLGFYFEFLTLLASLILVIFISASIIVYRFDNPELTETQLMIYAVKEYWWSLIILIISGIIVVKHGK